MKVLTFAGRRGGPVPVGAAGVIKPDKINRRVRREKLHRKDLPFPFFCFFAGECCRDPAFGR